MSDKPANATEALRESDAQLLDNTIAAFKRTSDRDGDMRINNSDVAQHLGLLMRMRAVLAEPPKEVAALLWRSIQITEHDEGLQLVITVPEGSAWMGCYEADSIAANVLLSLRTRIAAFDRSSAR